MAMLLALAGHDVKVSRNGLEALEIARRERPRHVLIDIWIPGLNGYDLAAALRRELDPAPTLIAVTCCGRDEDRRRAIEAGFDHHFLKPLFDDAMSRLLALLGPTEPAPPTLSGLSVAATTRGPIRHPIVIVNALGLHLRAADMLVRAARGFDAEVWILSQGHRVNVRSILDLTTLGAACGTRLELEADGAEAEAALNALTGLFARGFDELAMTPS